MSKNVKIKIPNSANWGERSIEDVCSLISRGSAPVYVENSSVAAIGQRCVTNAGFEPERARPHSERAIKGILVPVPGDVLVNSTGTGTIGRSCVYSGTGRFIVDGHVTVLRTRPELADGRWLNALVRSPWGQSFLETQCFAGSTNQVELSRTRLAAGRAAVPPLREQQKIAEILDTLDESIRKTEAIIAKLKQVKQGLLHDLLTRGIDENGELRDPERHPEQFKDSQLGRVPEQWKTGPLGTQFTLQRGFDITVAEQRPGTIPVVSSSGISSYHDTAMVQGAGVVTGRKGKLGDAYYLDGPFWPHDTTLWVKDFHGNDRRFAALFLSSFRLERFDAATSVPTLNRNFVHPIEVGVPQIAEQRRIVEVASCAAMHVESETCALLKLRLLKQGLMEDLLTGRVRVTPLLAESTP